METNQIHVVLQSVEYEVKYKSGINDIYSKICLLAIELLQEHFKIKIKK